MKSYLVFNLPEEQEEFKDALEGTSSKIKLEDVWQNCFRPFWKHGYNDPEIQKIVETKDGAKLMEFLIAKYQETVNND